MSNLEYHLLQLLLFVVFQVAGVELAVYPAEPRHHVCSQSTFVVVEGLFAVALELLCKLVAHEHYVGCLQLTVGSERQFVGLLLDLIHCIVEDAASLSERLQALRHIPQL